MLKCTHCDEPALAPVYDRPSDRSQERAFCCLGCLTVYQVLTAKGLEEYYRIKSQSGELRRRAPVSLKASELQYLDGPQFQEDFVRIEKSGRRSLSFYLEGIHCLACLWLLERLALFVPAVTTSRLDFERSILRVQLEENGKFSEVAQELTRLGYRPHPLRRSEDAENLRRREERWQLLRLGVAGAGASNIMIYAVSLYGGADGVYHQVFNALTVLFALPVMTFSAWPFYQSSWRALRQKTMSLDVPISMALLLGLAVGLFELWHTGGENYFDSLTALVFLLLLSRYALRRIQERSLDARDMHYFRHSDAARRVQDVEDGEGELVHPSFLKVGDLLRIAPLEFFPADGIVLRGEGSVQRALLTGEFAPARVSVGDEVHAGTQNLQAALVVKVLATEKDTALGKLLAAVEAQLSHETPTLRLVERISRSFLWAVLALSSVLFLWQWHTHSLTQAFTQALTLLIVTCPCALAISIPLTFSRSLSLAAKQGQVIKNAAALERLAHVKRVLLDKTGTLTYGTPQVSALSFQLWPTAEIAALVLALEERAQHPVGRALFEWAQRLGPRRLKAHHWEEVIGVGVRGLIAGVPYEIQDGELRSRGEVLARFELADLPLADAAAGILELRRLGLVPQLISGDREASVQALALEVGLRREEWQAQLSPMDKAAIAQESAATLMVGDGANDALALARASVGIAVHGGMELALKACDIYLLAPGLKTVSQLIVLARETLRLVRRNLVLSLSYNLISVIFVFTGHITPLLAAIIMPLSSLTVLASTLWGTKKLRQLWK